VLFVSDSRTYSGAEAVLLPCISAAGIEPHVLLPSRNRRFREKLEQSGVPYTLSDAFSNTPIRTTPNPVELGRFTRALLRVGRRIRALILEHQSDVIHSNSYPASLYAAAPARITGVKQIWHEHNIKQIHAVNRGLYGFVAGSCAWIVGPSNAVTNNLALGGLAPSKLRVVYNGVDLRRFETGAETLASARRSLHLDRGDRAIGLAAQLLPYKGHRTLIAAAPAILARFPSTRFFFIGALENPAYEAELRAELERARLIDRFTFTGWLDDLPAVLQAMDVVVTATTTPEPAAVTLQEAMAAGRPVVASRTGGTPELLTEGETGFLFEPGDASSAAATIVRILADAELAARLGRAGRRRVETLFSEERYLRDMRELYATAARDRRLP
jgi:glycosyltransferase involved in cell wall biosynthesis